MKNIFNINFKAIIQITFLFIASNAAFSQLATPFKIRHQGYVNGDMTMIANNIVNRVDYNNDSNSPHNNRAYQGELNDEYMMLYTDIDNEKSTFSSSSADLYLNNPLDKKIVYAGLYWSATYIYNSGISKKENKYKAVDPARESFSDIKIKLPNQTAYTDLKGELIFDGIKDAKFKESAPYAMYADITNLVKDLKDPTGTYTIANVKATQGKISGGVSAGWSIFFVYEDENMTGKFITTYDGFAGVTDKPTEINLSGFQTLPSGEVKAKIACAALEGDLNLKGDQIQFKAAENNEFTQLQNPLRDRANIFNSSITIEDKYFETRLPASKNTLGYDSFIMNIDNFDNSVIGNNTTDAILKLKTTGDRYFVFFNAFDVEVIKPKAIEKPQEIYAATTTEVEPTKAVASIETPKPIVNTVKVEKPIEAIVSTEAPKAIVPVKVEKPVAVATKPIIVSTPEIVVSAPVVVQKTEVVAPEKTEYKEAVLYPDNKNLPVAVTKTVVESVVHNNLASQTVVKNTNRVTPIESPAVLIASQPEGYYIIVNVFAVHSNATRFVSKLKKQGMFADYFINPINNYRYVYVSKHNSFQDATQMYASNINGQYYDAFWIMTVNKQNNPNGAVAMNETSINANQVNTVANSNSLNMIAIIDRNIILTTDKRKNKVS